MAAYGGRIDFMFLAPPPLSRPLDPLLHSVFPFLLEILQWRIYTDNFRTPTPNNRFTPPSSVLGLVPSLRNPGSSLICQLELMNTTKRYNFSEYNGKKIYLQKNPCDYRLGLSIAF